MIYPFLKKSLFILKIPFKITCTPGHGQIYHYKEISNQKSGHWTDNGMEPTSRQFFHTAITSFNGEQTSYKKVTTNS